MTRLFVALAIASFSFMASAAEKPLPVTVTNPVLPVEVSNSEPIPVTDASGAGRTTFRERIRREFSGANQSTKLAIPLGKRAVFKHVSGLCVAESPTFSFVRIIIANGNYITYVAPQFIRTVGTTNWYTFNHILDVAVEKDDSADREAAIEGLFAGPPADGACEAIVSGYFE